ncbi:MAG TPA: transketolase C-terminal domain-containing protein, partial [Chlamydiales bacterium]
FNTTRCLEQIRNDICYHNVPVLVVGTGAGLSYASLGCTHHSCEDISFLKSIPNMTVLCPGDAMELRSLLRCSFQANGPMYMRIGKAGEPIVHTAPPALEIGKGFRIQSGENLCLFSTGNMLPTTLEIAALLQKEGLSAEVISLHTVKPLDKALLASLTQKFPVWVSLEEHSLIGGLGSSIAEWMIDQHVTQTRLIRFGTPDLFPHPIGSQKYLRNQYGLEAKEIVSKILKEIQYANTSSHPR